MTRHLQAIYDNGIFRPIGPVNLPDQTLVGIVVMPTVTAFAAKGDEANGSEESQDEIAARQWQAAKELDDLMQKLPNACPNDGFSGADHDRILYGGPA
jgi:predicted DNA-binding antitoxin AbrB/MazE fold protein